MAIEGRDYDNNLIRRVRVDQDGRLEIVLAGESVPEAKGAIFNTVVAINTDFFAADIAPTNTPTTFRISVCLDAAGVLNVMREELLPAPVTVTEHLNEGNVLAADCLYEFNVTVAEGQTINFQHSVGGTILSCTVVEIYG